MPKLPPASTSPPEKVEVAVEVLSIEPPVIVKPVEESKPPPATEIPPENVEVPVEDTSIVPVPICRDPLTLRLFSTVEVPAPPI